MNRGSKTSHIAMIVIGLLLGGALAGGAAIAQRNQPQAKVKTAYLSISTMDMAPDSISDPAFDYFNSWFGNVLSNSDGSRCFNTGVNLPQGAVVKSATFFYQSDATGDFYGEIRRVNPSSGASTTLVQRNPTDDSDTRTSVTGAVPALKATINNSKFQYGLGACLSDGTVFMGARIRYTYKV